MTIVDALLLLLVANGAPIVAWKICGERWAGPIDRGVHFIDGRPLFGTSKTLRGAVAAIGATMALSYLLGYSALLGASFGLLVIVGDLLSSFIKRRLRIAPSGMALGLDQIPESLLPLLVLYPQLHFEWRDVVALVAAFFVLELLISRAAFLFRLRKTPY